MIKLKKPTLRFKQILSTIANKSQIPGLLAMMSEEGNRIATSNARSFKNVQGRSWKKLKKGGFPSWIADSIVVKTLTSGFEIASNHRAGLWIIKGAKRRGTKWKLSARSFAPKKAELTGNFVAILEKGIEFMNKLFKS